MTSEQDADSLTTTAPPPHRQHRAGPPSSPPAAAHSIRLMCSFGGRILPRPHDHQLRYVGGDTRIVSIPRSASFSTLLSKLSKLPGPAAPADQLSIKYQLPNDDLEALISLTSDEDVDNMMIECDRLFASRTPRLRLFLFPAAAAAFGAFLDRSGGSKRDDWFLDALNGAVAAPQPVLERGRSEASSIISEVPDYLFGFDSIFDEASIKTSLALENLCLSEPAIKNLFIPKVEEEEPVEQQISRQNSYVPNPVWQVVAEPVPVYYVPGPMMPGGSTPVQPVPLPFVAHQAGGGQAPVGYAAQAVQAVLGNPVHGGPVYVGGAQLAGAAYGYAGTNEAYEFVAGEGW